MYHAMQFFKEEFSDVQYGPKNTLTSHLVPHCRELCKKLETNGLAINKVHMCNILKRVVNSTSLQRK